MVDSYPDARTVEGGEPSQDGISWLDVLLVLGQYKALLLGLPLLAALVAVAVGFWLTPIYTARTTFISPPAASGNAMAASAFGGLGGGLGALAMGVAGGGTGEVWVTVLKSRSAKDELINTLGLEGHYKTASRQDLYARLDGVVRIGLDKKTGLINIEADDPDPAFAAKLANAHYTVLRKLMTRLAVTEAQQRRQFFELQFDQAKTELANAEVAMKETQERTGVLELSSQAQGTLNAVARLRAEVAQREVQLSALRTFATAENQEVQRVQAEIMGLRSEIKKLEGGGQSKDKLATANLPAQGLAYVRALREVKYREAIFEMMAKQYELAKVDEAKEGGSVQQLDAALQPEQRSAPKRKELVLFAMLGGFLVALFFALVHAFAQRLLFSAEHASEVLAVKQAWRFGWWRKG